jgi:hypothetical protein
MTRPRTSGTCSPTTISSSSSQHDEDHARAKQLIDDYQAQRSERVRLETQQKIEQGEYETFAQRLANKPLQVLITLAIVAFIIYVSVMPFLEFGRQ